MIFISIKGNNILSRYTPYTNIFILKEAFIPKEE
jgi:hypothetical protein